MSMSGLLYTKNDTDILIAKQATWGTLHPAGSAMTIMDVEPASIDPDYNIRHPNRSNSSARIQRSENIQIDSKGSTPKVILTGDAKALGLDHLLYAVFQQCSEGAASPFAKTFTFPPTQPDFTVSPATNCAFYTIVEKHPLASSSKAMYDAICNSLKLSCYPDSNNGRLQAAATFLGRGPIIENHNPVGTYTREAQTFFYFHDIATFMMGSSYPTIMGFEIEFSQPKTKGVSTAGGSGKFYQWAIPEYAVKMKLTLAVNSESNTAINRGTDAETFTSLSWGTAGVAPYLSISLKGKAVSAPIKIADVNAWEVEYEGTYDGTTQPTTVVLTNGTDRAW